jgi:hypothetical protein
MMGQVLYKASFEDQTAADFKNATLAFAVLGGVLGLVLGFAGGLSGRSALMGAKAGSIGLVLGGLLGAGASFVLLPVYFRASDRTPEALSQDMLLPFLVHGGIWAACGLAGGLALALGLGGGRERLIHGALGGLIGAILGTLGYEMVGALLFTAAKTTSPVSWTWTTRLIGRLLVAGVTGLVAGALLDSRGGRGPQPSSASPPA